MQQCSPNSNPGMLSSQTWLGVVGLCLLLCDSKVNPGASLLIAQPHSSLMFSILKTHRLFTRSICFVWFSGQLLNSPSLVSTQPCLTSPSTCPGTVPLNSLFWTPGRHHHRWVSGAWPLLAVSCFLQLYQMVWFYTALLNPQPPALCLELYMNTKQFGSCCCFESWLVGLICCLWSWTCTSWSCFTSPIIVVLTKTFSISRIMEMAEWLLLAPRDIKCLLISISIRNTRLKQSLISSLLQIHWRQRVLLKWLYSVFSWKETLIVLATTKSCDSKIYFFLRKWFIFAFPHLPKCFIRMAIL